MSDSKEFERQRGNPIAVSMEKQSDSSDYACNCGELLSYNLIKGDNKCIDLNFLQRSCH